jgi:hypothetical protein
MLGYISKSEKVNIMHHSSKHPDYTRKDQIDLVWKKIKRGLNESGNFLLHIFTYYNSHT